jgi:hypothetical protein
VLVAIVLELVGVPDELICADFAATAAAVDPINARLARNAVEYGEVWPPPEGPDGLDWHPTAAMMATTLDRVRARWGSGEGWARAHGLTDSELTSLRERLTS